MSNNTVTKANVVIELIEWDISRSDDKNHINLLKLKLNEVRLMRESAENGENISDIDKELYKLYDAYCEYPIYESVTNLWPSRLVQKLTD